MWSEDEIKAKMGKVHCMDCMDFMVNIPDNYFDLICCDPPYGIGEHGGKSESRCKATGVKPTNYAKKSWDKKIPDPEIFEQIKRISRNQIIFGGNYFIEYLNNSSCWLVWDKLNGNNDFADCELAWTNFKTAVRKYEYKCFISSL